MVTSYSGNVSSGILVGVGGDHVRREVGIRPLYGIEQREIGINQQFVINIIIYGIKQFSLISSAYLSAVSNPLDEIFA